MRKRIILITGTRKGIGKHLAHYYVEMGHAVFGCSRTEPDWSLQGYQHFKADVSNESDVKRVLAGIRKEHQGLDVLINNAGAASMNHVLLTPASTVELLFQVNFMGTFLFSREAAKLMRNRPDGGRIVNFTTIAIPLRLTGEAIYAATKAAVATFSEILAREIAPYGITVNTIGPTPVDTDLIRNVPKDKLDAILQRQGIPRLGTFEDITNCVDFFISQRSGFITGQTLYMGGN